MAPSLNKPRTANRNQDLIRGIGKFSKSKMYHKSRIWAIKAKNGGALPKHSSATVAEKPAEKPPKFYPADNVKKPIANRRKPKPTKLSCPFKVNGVPLRHVNQSYVIATSTKVDISRVNVDKFDDKYFKKEAEKKKKKTEGEFFEAEKEPLAGVSFAAALRHPSSRLLLGFPSMGKKRKQEEAQEVVKKDDTAPPCRKRTLLGRKDGGVVKKSDSVVFRNKEKVLVTCSRRIISRYRHLMMDVVSLLPHCKKDSKVESKETKGATLNEIVELRNCSSILFFECRKQKDLYLWMGKSPGGPSAKFLVNAVHTMEELKLTGNHLKGSRPILTFSSNFDQEPHWKILKELIMQIFGTPKDHGKAKPFHDHVFVFSIVDRHIWFRNYQISVPHNEIDKVDRGGLDKMTLVEVGPRFCLNPIKIFGGSFGGPTLYENPLYISPNLERAQQKREKATKYVKKVKAKTRRKMHVMENPLEPDEFADLWKI